MLPKFESVSTFELVWMYSIYALVVIMSVISNLRTARSRKELEDSSSKALEGVSGEEKLKRLRLQYGLIKYYATPHELISLTLMSVNLVFVHFAVIIFSGKNFLSYVLGSISSVVILLCVFRIWFWMKYGITAKSMKENYVEIPRESNHVLDFAFTFAVFGSIILLLNLIRIDVLLALLVGGFVSLFRLRRLIKQKSAEMYL